MASAPRSRKPKSEQLTPNTLAKRAKRAQQRNDRAEVSQAPSVYFDAHGLTLHMLMRVGIR